MIVSLGWSGPGDDIFNGVQEGGIWGWALRRNDLDKRCCSMSQMFVHVHCRVSWNMVSLIEVEIRLRLFLWFNR